MAAKHLIMISLFVGTTFSINSGVAGWQDLLKEADKVLKSSTGQSTSSAVTSSLSNDEIASGLKEALDIGVKKAVNLLGRKDGFLKDQSVKIPMPDNLQQIEKALRSFGQEEMADEFVTSMNRAAEQAVPKVTNVFVDSIAKMSLSDAQGILSGGDTAATDYFKNNTSEELTKLIKPYVNKAMDSNQVTQYYKSMTAQVKKYDNFGLMNKYLGNAAELDDYVTDKTMAGLFSKIAEQEKLIRQNPAARSTELLKEVFGSITN